MFAVLIETFGGGGAPGPWQFFLGTKATRGVRVAGGGTMGAPGVLLYVSWTGLLVPFSRMRWRWDRSYCFRLFRGGLRGFPRG